MQPTRCSKETSRFLHLLGLAPAGGYLAAMLPWTPVVSYTNTVSNIPQNEFHSVRLFILAKLIKFRRF